MKDNSKPPPLGGSGKTSHDKKSNDNLTDVKPEDTDYQIKSFTDYTINLLKRLKEQNFGKHMRQVFGTDDATQSELMKQLSLVQEKIEELFDKVLRQVFNFLSKDIDNLNNHTEEDKDNLRKMLSEYKTVMEKILEEHTENVNNIRAKLHTKIISQEEIEKFISLFDGKMLETMERTDKMFEMLKRSELETFKTTLRKVLETCRDDIEKSNDSFIKRLEEVAENPLTPAEEPRIFQIKLPNISKIFALTPRSSDSQSRNNNLEKPSPFPPMAGKLPSFNIKKFFDSETNKGRANAAKVTYLGVLIGFLYWKWKTSRS